MSLLPPNDRAFAAFLRMKREAETAGGETWIGFRAGLIFRGCWHFSRGEQIPGWWGWFR